MQTEDAICLGLANATVLCLGLFRRRAKIIPTRNQVRSLCRQGHKGLFICEPWIKTHDLLLGGFTHSMQHVLRTLWESGADSMAGAISCSEGHQSSSSCGISLCSSPCCFVSGCFVGPLSTATSMSSVNIRHSRLSKQAFPVASLPCLVHLPTMLGALLEHL